MNEHQVEERLQDVVDGVSALQRTLEHVALDYLMGEKQNAARGVMGLRSGRVLKVVGIAGNASLNLRCRTTKIDVAHEIEDGVVISETISLYDVESVQTPESLQIDEPYEVLVDPISAKRIAMETIEMQGDPDIDGMDLSEGAVDGPHRTPFIHRLVTSIKEDETDPVLAMVRRIVMDDLCMAMISDEITIRKGGEVVTKAYGMVKQAVAKDRMYSSMIQAYRPYIVRSQWLAPFQGYADRI